MPSITVIKLGGNVCNDPATIATLQEAWPVRNAGERWVLVHGGGTQIDQALQALGEPVMKIDGLRVTSPAAAQVVQTTLDDVGATLVQILRDHGLPAVHVPASARRLEAVVKQTADGALGRVGTATVFDAPSVLAAVPPGQIMVVTPVGWDAEGPLNVNADEGAVMVAASMGADRLILATDVAGVLDASGLVHRHLDGTMVRLFLADGTATGGMVPKLQNALSAMEGGVREVTIGALGCLHDDTTGTRIHLGDA